jgi:hypothetical protein
MADTIFDTGEGALDTVVGGGALALDAARRPGRTARRARGRGAQATDAITEQIEGTLDGAMALPERLLHAYLRGVRARARRRDPIGSVSQALLRAVHLPALEAARFFARLERETALPRKAAGGRSRATTSRRQPVRAVRRAASAAGRGRRRGPARGSSSRSRRSA